MDERCCAVDFFPRQTAVNATLQDYNATVHIATKDLIQRDFVATNPNDLVAKLTKQRCESLSKTTCRCYEAI